PVGRSLVLGGVSRTIVGVMPPSFRYPTATTEVWMPAQYSPGLLQAREARFLFAVGRLKPGVTLERGRDDLSAVQSRLGLQFPRTDAGWSAAVVPLKEEQIGGVRRSLWLLLAAVTLVLVAACVNIACLLVAEASRREREIAVSLALGASRARIVSQLLVEGTLLATLGALASLLFSRWTIGLLRTGRFGAVGGVTLARLREVALDRRLLLFTIVAGVSTTVLFALAPALQAARKDVASRLGHASRTQSVGQQGLQRLLVTVQVALAIVLLAGAGLMVRSFSRLQHVSAGFDPSQVLAFRMSAQWTERPDAVTNRQLRTLARLSAVPGIVSSAFAQALPATVDYPPGEFKIVGRDTGEHLFGHARAVSADYFKTLRIPILQGETCRDDPTRLYANILVTRSWADHFFPNESPIGHYIESLSFAGPKQRIIGIVGDVRELGLAKDPPLLYYSCGLQANWPDPFFIVRTDRDMPIAGVRNALHDIEPTRAVYAVQFLTEALDATLSQQRLNTVLLGSFAATALLLAAIGLYGVMSQFVSARRRELGVRLALGARAGHILSTVAAPAMVTTVAGTAIGLVGAVALSRYMTTLVFDVSTHDPVTLAVVPLLLTGAAVAATIPPVRRATRTDPMEALRED
ncbi:MAG TPA: FtsX-like permease family protein, partial [Vicinamibacterales bacterium]|nr:FtsX-like permease family protein [Vicinamibacterales bacterium]